MTLNLKTFLTPKRDKFIDKHKQLFEFNFEIMNITSMNLIKTCSVQARFSVLIEEISLCILLHKQFDKTCELKSFITVGPRESHVII